MIEIATEYLCLCAVTLVSFAALVAFVFIRRHRQRRRQVQDESNYQIYSLLTRHKLSDHADRQQSRLQRSSWNSDSQKEFLLTSQRTAFFPGNNSSSRTSESGGQSSFAANDERSQWPVTKAPPAAVGRELPKHALEQQMMADLEASGRKPQLEAPPPRLQSPMHNVTI